VLNEIYIVAAWIEDLQQVLGNDPVVVSEVRIEVFSTVVRLFSGHVGVAFTPRDLEHYSGLMRPVSHEA
jgi:hypothetical protein